VLAGPAPLSGTAGRQTLLVAVYAAAIIVSAALLFLVQPMFARMVLPLLGGSPAVWNTAVVFYQVMLLAGYAYAYVVTRWLGLRQQLGLHLLVLLLPVLVLPIKVPEGWTPPATEHPVGWLLALFGVTVGLPFFVVAASSPLLQRWFAASRHTAAGDPYFLYGASNLGSLLALLGYPLFVERWLRLGDQTRWWAWGYAALALLIAACAAAVWRTPDAASIVDTEAPDAATESSALTWRDRASWMALAAMPVSFMLSVTTYISTDISAIPLLWIIPLTLYLLTFVVAFAPRTIVSSRPLVRVLPFALSLLAFLLATANDVTNWWLMLVHLAAFFLAALTAHTELASRRPSPQRLAEFYLWVALGGAIGGIVNALVAPLIFKHVEEYPLTLILAAALLPRITDPGPAPKPLTHQKRRTAAPAAKRPGRALKLSDVVIAAVMFATVALLVRGLLLPDGGLSWTSRVIVFGLPSAIALTFVGQPVRFALTLGAIMLGSALYNGKGTYLHTERTFFGVNHVILFSTGGYHLLDHGTTLHGAQSLEPSRRREPLTYFHPTGPLGDVFASLPPEPAARAVAVVGLGAGSIACYRRSGDRWTFYEIDPAVVRIARNGRYFTYLEECAPDARIVVGDARLRLTEAQKSEYQLIIIDAYSSDAIPVHLLTREAFELYFDKLAAGGMLALNISNRQLELKTVIGNVARDLGLAYRARDNLNLPAAEANRGKMPSQWMVIARSVEDLRELAVDPRWVVPPIRPGTSVWTDDFNNLLSALNWRR